MQQYLFEVSMLAKTYKYNTSKCINERGWIAKGCLFVITVHISIIWLPVKFKPILSNPLKAKQASEQKWLTSVMVLQSYIPKSDNLKYPNVHRWVHYTKHTTFMPNSTETSKLPTFITIGNQTRLFYRNIHKNIQNCFQLRLS